MMIRPQKKKEKADAEMRDSLKVGDEVMTIGGVVGKIIKISDFFNTKNNSILFKVLFKFLNNLATITF